MSASGEPLQLLEEASAHREKEFEDFRTAFNSDSPQGVRAIGLKLADDPRFQELMKQKADLPKQTNLPIASDSGTL